MPILLLRGQTLSRRSAPGKRHTTRRPGAAASL